MNECANPECSNELTELGEVFCSQRCEQQFDEWAADMALWLDHDHRPHHTELEVAQ